MTYVQAHRLLEEDMPITDEDAIKIAGHVWAGYLIQGRHANTILRDINGDTDFLRDQAVKGLSDVQLKAIATAVNDELARRQAE
jgi:hypothetical protein